MPDGPYEQAPMPERALEQAPMPERAQPPGGQSQTPAIDRFITSATERLSQLSPQGIQQVAQDAMSAVTDVAGRVPGFVDQLTALSRGGQPSPDVIAGAGNQLQRQGHPPQSIPGILQGMDAGQHMLLWGGLGLGAIGLISAMSGQGGVLPWLLTTLGLGVAGGTAANAGMFGQGAQQGVQSLLQRAGIGGGPTPAPPPQRRPAMLPGPASGIENFANQAGEQVQRLGSVFGLGSRPQPGQPGIASQGIQAMINNASPQLLQTAMPMMLPPDQQAQLDAAIGYAAPNSGMSQQLMAWAGPMLSNPEQSIMQQLGVNQQGAQNILSAWRSHRNRPAPSSGGGFR